MNIRASQPQGRPRNLSEIPRQQLRDLPQESGMTRILDSTFSRTVGGIEKELCDRKASGQSKALWGTALAAGASALLAWQGGLQLSATGVCASLTGLAGLGLGGTGLARYLSAKSDLETLKAGSAEVEKRSLQTVEGKLEDRRFMTGEGLRSALEVSDPSTGQVIERVVQAENLTAREDVGSGQVTLSAENKSISFPGTIQLPTRENKAASINHALSAPLGDLNASVLELGIEGENWMRITGPSQWDSDGFSYEPGLAFAGGDHCEPAGPQNTVRVESEEGTYTFQSPLDLQAFESGRLKLAESMRMEPMQATLETPPPPPPAKMSLGEYLEVQGQANKMLKIRAEATSRYLETEARYANNQAHASALEPHRAEIKDLQENWKLLSPRPDSEDVLAPKDARERRQLTSLQLDLLEVRGQAQGVKERSDRVRSDGLYQAKGPKEAATALLTDIQGELDRVGSLLKEKSQA